MLIRGQTTEQRIADIADKFKQGVDGYSAGQRRFNDAQREQNRYDEAKSLQQEALKRQKAIQAFELSSKIASDTGRIVDPSAIAPMIDSGDLSSLGDILKSAPMTPKYTQQQEDRKLDQEFKRSQINKNNAEANKKNTGLTEGEKKVDADYAKDINDWTATGKASLAKNLQSLKEARKALDDDKSLSGGLTGVLPDRLTSDRVLAQRQRVGSAVQGSLRATLGSSFTEGEGNRTLANSYNEAADAKTNKASLDKLIAELESQASINDLRAEYFRNNGTLKGFNPQAVSQSVTTKQAASSSAPWEKYKK